MLNRSDYINLIEAQYFGNMAAARPDRVLNLLTDDAQLTAFSGSMAPRLVRREPRAGQESFEHFLSALHIDFTLHYSDFIHFVEVDREQSACTFRLEVRSRDPSSQIGTRVLRNCNFFKFREGLIHRVTAYFSVPSVDCDPWC